MTDQPDGNDRRKLDEPFKLAKESASDNVGDSGSGCNDAGDGIFIPHRRVIKVSTDAPHLMVCIPIGGREEQDVVKCGKCGEISPGGDSYRAPGMVPAELLANIVNVMPPLGVTVSFMFLKNNLSAVLREQMTKQALKVNADFVFFWDDDTIIPGDTWYKLLAKMKKYPDIGAITGVYFTKLSPSEPILYKDPGKGAYWGFDLNPDAEPEDVFAAGAGCLMVRTAAIRKMEPPYWSDERHTNEAGTLQHISGHDIRFCRKLQTETGYRMTVDGSLQCMHVDPQKQRIYKMPTDAPPVAKAREMSDEFVSQTPLPTKLPVPELVVSTEQVADLLEVSVNGSPSDR